MWGYLSDESTDNLDDATLQFNHECPECPGGTGYTYTAKECMADGRWLRKKAKRPRRPIVRKSSNANASHTDGPRAMSRVHGQYHKYGGQILQDEPLWVHAFGPRLHTWQARGAAANAETGPCFTLPGIPKSQPRRTHPFEHLGHYPQSPRQMRRVKVHCWMTEYPRTRMARNEPVL